MGLESGTDLECIHMNHTHAHSCKSVCVYVRVVFRVFLYVGVLIILRCGLHFYLMYADFLS